MLSPINFENLTGKSQLYQTNCIHWFTFKINRSFVLILSNIDLITNFSRIAFGWVDQPAFWVVFEIFL